MHFDGASQGNPGPGGCGAILLVRIATRLQPLAFTARYIEDQTNTNNSAEYKALLDGLELAVTHDITHLHIIGDSELVVNQTKGLAKVNFRLREQARQVQQWMSHFQVHTIRNVPRERNQAADYLSKHRTKGTAPLINQTIAGWDDEATLLHFLKVEKHIPP
jgi:ribonuclease HI